MDKYIFHKRKALDRRTCEHLINIFEKSNPVLIKKHDYYAIYPHLTEDIKFSFLKPILRKYIMGEYAKKHKFLNFLYAKWNIDEWFNIQRYNPGQYYDSMYDVVRTQGHMEHGANEDSRRLLAWMFYLNDIKKDGGTCWPQQNFTTKPRAGDLYVWPAGWTHSHYGIPALKETKYIITGWCSFLG